ncbi:pyridoxal-phosphate dependent enzyme [Candidatus Woesearchaeota archaeon]|nr:pyridoxal-phosphate dependent enzyme [Candidatus Woesearchaeota archaeon]
MDTSRGKIYNDLEAEIGNTPLYKLSRIQFPHGNEVYAKEEWQNPGGSHYDRVFVKLFYDYEKAGKITPGKTPVVETTSGSAGVSFARLGRLLGYQCLVICPENLSARIEAIQNEGAEVRLTPKKEYVEGSAAALRKPVKKENKERLRSGKPPYFPINHSQLEMSATAVEAAVNEAAEQALQQYGIKFDLAIAAGGNGTTALGFGRAAKRHGIPLVLWESLGSGLYFNKKFGEGAFQYKYGLNPGELSTQVGHAIYGTVYGPTSFKLPNVDRAFEEGVLDNVRIVADETTKRRALVNAQTRKFDPRIGSLSEATISPPFSNNQEPNLRRIKTIEPVVELLKDTEGKPVGRSSAGNIAMLLDEHWNIAGFRNVLTFFYDALSRY